MLHLLPIEAFEMDEGETDDGMHRVHSAGYENHHYLARLEVVLVEDKASCVCILGYAEQTRDGTYPGICIPPPPPPPPPSPGNAEKFNPSLTSTPGGMSSHTVRIPQSPDIVVLR